MTLESFNTIKNIILYPFFFNQIYKNVPFSLLIHFLCKDILTDCMQYKYVQDIHALYWHLQIFADFTFDKTRCMFARGVEVGLCRIRNPADIVLYTWIKDDVSSLKTANVQHLI